MIYRIMLTLLLFAALNSPPARASAVECEGRFVFRKKRLGFARESR